MPVLRGVHQRRESAQQWTLIPLLGLGAGGEEGLHLREIAFLGGEEKIAGGVVGFGLGLSRGFEQRDDLGVILAAGAD